MLFYYHNCNSKLETTRKTKKSYNSQLFQKWIASHLKHYYTHFLKLFRTDLFVQQIASKNRISMLILLHFLHMIRHQFWIERHFFNQLVFAREKNNQIIRISKLNRLTQAVACLICTLRGDLKTKEYPVKSTLFFSGWQKHLRFSRAWHPFFF